jgi:hypothetical protein
MSTPKLSSVAAALPAATKSPKKLGRSLKGSGPRIHKVVSLFDAREWEAIQERSEDDGVAPRDLVRIALRTLGVMVALS